MQSLLTRVLSAVVGISIIGALIYLFGKQGLVIIMLFLPVLGVFELRRLLFNPDDSRSLQFVFSLCLYGVFILSWITPELSMIGFAVISVVFCSVCILLEKKFEDINQLSFFQAKAILGFFYLGILPALAARLLDLENGEIWFLMMLAVVFAGDTLAYFFGILWGDKKISPNISPKKTFAGSFGGLVGSVGAMALCLSFTNVKFYLPFLGIALVTGLVAQFGDLFESLLKRVANIKDSGKIMPGHGGVLDRIDGVLFGAPVFLLGLTLVFKFFPHWM